MFKKKKGKTRLCCYIAIVAHMLSAENYDIYMHLIDYILKSF